MIYVKAGGDSTQLFNSYHPSYVEKMLDKYCIGHLDQSGKKGSSGKSISYEQETCEFYTTVRARVFKYMKDNKVRATTLRQFNPLRRLLIDFNLNATDESSIRACHVHQDGVHLDSLGVVVHHDVLLHHESSGKYFAFRALLPKKERCCSRVLDLTASPCFALLCFSGGTPTYRLRFCSA